MKRFLSDIALIESLTVNVNSARNLLLPNPTADGKVFGRVPALGPLAFDPRVL
jgi:hypothetical protein